MSIVLEASDLLLLRAAQRALLSVPEPGTAASTEVIPGQAGPRTAWVDGVAAALRPLFGTDHVYYSEPIGTGGDATLFARHPLVGDEFTRGLQQFFVGFDNGFTRFQDGTTTMIRRLVRSAGSGAFHDAPLYDARRQTASALHQEVFRPIGVERKLALSVPLPAGEAMLVVGLDAPSAPGFEGRRHRTLELLLPAFEAGLRIRRHLQRQPFGLDVVAGGAPIPILFIDDEGRERYRNAAFRALLNHLRRQSFEGSSAVTPDRLMTTAHALSASVASSHARSRPRPHVVSGTALSARETGAATLSVGGFRLRASVGTTYRGTPGTLVFVETPLAGNPLGDVRDREQPPRVLPTTGAVQARTDLTEREAEVALRIAEGDTDQQVAERLGISIHTARRHAGSILKKLDLNS